MRWGAAFLALTRYGWNRRDASGDFQGDFFSSVEYLQADFIVAPQLTLLAGSFLTTFNVYN